MDMDMVIKNGEIVTASDVYEADVGIGDGKIVAIGKGLEGNETIDARGMYVMPGGVDAHVHLQLPFCGTVSADDFENGTRAAACGGVTTVIDFAIQSAGKTLMETIEARRKEADGKVCIDYGLHAGITNWKNPGVWHEMEEAVRYGIPSFNEIFMVYRKEGWIADDYDLWQALVVSRKLGALICVHAENVFVTESLTEKYLSEGKTSAYHHALSRPNFTEGEAIQRAITLAEAAQGNLFIVYMSTKEGVKAVAEGRTKGISVSAETCPHYLVLTDDLFRGENGHCYATCPPLRKQEDCAGLWAGLVDGSVQTIGTDTCTFTTEQKNMWEGDFTKIPYGLPGVENLLPVIHTAGVNGGKFSINKLVRLVSTNPAKLFGLYPQKGTIAVGSDADICIFDPDRKVVMDYRELQTNCDWSPYQGMKLKGYPAVTVSRGRVVAREGKFVGEVGWGRFLKRKAGGHIESNC
ncbi:dihydropyrimidinase [Dehalococcoidia bacterium]|nr:dihydropyrimidinase [Dehalococcoidia bacterium]